MYGKARYSALEQPHTTTRSCRMPYAAYTHSLIFPAGPLYRLVHAVQSEGEVGRHTVMLPSLRQPHAFVNWHNCTAPAFASPNCKRPLYDTAAAAYWASNNHVRVPQL